MRNETGAILPVSGPLVEGAVPLPDPIEFIRGVLLRCIDFDPELDDFSSALEFLDQIQQGRDTSPRGLTVDEIECEMERRNVLAYLRRGAYPVNLEHADLLHWIQEKQSGGEAGADG